MTAEIRDAAAHPYRARPRLRRHRRGVFRSPLAAVAAFASLRFRSSASRLARRRRTLRAASSASRRGPPPRAAPAPPPPSCLHCAATSSLGSRRAPPPAASPPRPPHQSPHRGNAGSKKSGRRSKGRECASTRRRARRRGVRPAPPFLLHVFTPSRACSQGITVGELPWIPDWEVGQGQRWGGAQERTRTRRRCCSAIRQRRQGRRAWRGSVTPIRESEREPAVAAAAPSAAQTFARRVLLFACGNEAGLPVRVRRCSRPSCESKRLHWTVGLQRGPIASWRGHLLVCHRL